MGLWYLVRPFDPRTEDREVAQHTGVRAGSGWQTYIVTFETNWVKNARAAGWGFLTRGGKKEHVALVELPIEERPPILREFPHQVPHGVQFFERVLGLPNDPEAFAAAALRCPVFRIEAI